MIVNTIEFPAFTGIRCLMMPFIQGDSSSLPEQYKPYADIINSIYLEKGLIGHLTIDESYVTAGQSQRGYNSAGIKRNVHIEVGQREGYSCWGGGGSSWGGRANTILDDNTSVIIANSVTATCKYWNNMERRYTKDGDLSQYINDYPEYTGTIMESGDVAWLSIFNPHECIPQRISGNRQFIRVVGNGVTGREEYFTINPLLV